MRQRSSINSALIRAAITLCFCLTGCGQGGSNSTIHKLQFALPNSDWWTAAPFIVARNRSIFREHLLDMEFIQVNSGLASKNAVLAGTADMGLSAATPLALGAARQEAIVVLGQYLHSSAVVGLVGPKGTIGSGVPPGPVAIVPSTISESYLYSYLAQIGQQGLMERKQLRELIARPADVSSDLKSGSAKSAVVWEPFLSIAAALPGLEAKTDVVQYDVSLFLLSRPEFAKNRKADITRFLAGMKDACDYITRNPDEARKMVEQEFSFAENFLAPAWPRVSYKVQFDAGAMRSEIEREGRIARALGAIQSEGDVSYMLRDGPFLPESH
jgi:ABC-type nitrate/sulfonate/bicarbonate transport system substrate-binding protein